MKIKFFYMILSTSLVLTFGITLTSCGQRGPLYLPKDSTKNLVSKDNQIRDI